MLLIYTTLAQPSPYALGRRGQPEKAAQLLGPQFHGHGMLLLFLAGSTTFPKMLLSLNFVEQGHPLINCD